MGIKVMPLWFVDFEVELLKEALKLAINETEDEVRKVLWNRLLNQLNKFDK